MAEIINFDFEKSRTKKNESYKSKLIRIRDEIEDYLVSSSLDEKDELAVALASGRFAIMKLTQLSGKEETKEFVNECIATSLRDINKSYN
ncbi:MAG: hypothetical protein O3A39_10755 [Proteobacteria bacterium]|jgi:hypothetical protein|nr:hypothetical protein [Pseudomonadota bacterium]MDA1135615.1 hypothetical protein [Pseudomonadota bacterium]|tara:strand:+ start:580 stop:849 length:270 start_codon:yes stop_codon:yes gene_type:complete